MNRDHTQGTELIKLRITPPPPPPQANTGGPCVRDSFHEREATLPDQQLRCQMPFSGKDVSCLGQ